MDRWCGKVAVVTGAGGGIGAAIATALTNAGMKVVALDISFGDEEKKVLADKATLHSLKCDLTKLEEIVSSFNWIEATLGDIGVLINCAGYSKMGHITSVGDNPLTDEEISRTMDVNIKAMIFCTRQAVDSMKKRGFDGHIININSIAGHYVAFTPEFNVYASSKYAVTAFTQSLANELGHFGSKIKVTSVSPGLVQTPLSNNLVKDFSVVSALQPRDVADAVLYVLSTPPNVNITEITVQPVTELRK